MMKRLMIALLLGVTTFISPAMAEVTLQLPEKISMVAKNGKKSNITRIARLPDGINQIAIRFKGEFGLRHMDDDADLGYSDVFVVKFIASNSALVMKTPPIRDTYQLKKFNRNPDIRIVDKSGRPVHIQTGRLEKQGLQIFRDYAEELSAFNKTNSPAAIHSSEYQSAGSVSSAAQSAEDMHTPQPASKSKDHASNRIRKQLYPSSNASPRTERRFPQSDPSEEARMAEKMLKYWYQQADEATRQRFRAWINQ